MRAVLLMVLLALPFQAQSMWVGNKNFKQFAGPWYILATASRERDFPLVKETKNIRGVIVSFLPEDKIKILFSQEGENKCTHYILEMTKEDPEWIYENPDKGILEYRVLATDFKTYAIVFTQLDFVTSTYNTIDLYSRKKEISKNAVKQFVKWRKELGYRTHQQALLKENVTCAHQVIY